MNELYQQMMNKLRIQESQKESLILSILMPTIPERKKMFNRLKKELDKQIEKVNEVHPVLGKVEILIDDRPKYREGGPSIGEKRQALLERAEGEYVCFLDDDESVSPNYVEEILRLCYEKPDIGTFSSISKLEHFWCLVVMRLHHGDNQQVFPGVVLRRPWHVCPVRRELALSAKFPDSNYGEDWVWFENVLKRCGTEKNTSAILHQYNFNPSVSQADNVTTAI